MQITKEQLSDNILVTTVVYRADEFGGIKMEIYKQERLPDGQFTLDYSEHYDVIEPYPTMESQHLQPVVASDSNVDAESDKQSENGSSEVDTNDDDDNDDEEEELSEEEKKGCLPTRVQLY